MGRGGRGRGCGPVVVRIDANLLLALRRVWKLARLGGS